MSRAGSVRIFSHKKDKYRPRFGGNRLFLGIQEAFSLAFWFFTSWKGRILLSAESALLLRRFCLYNHINEGHHGGLPVKAPV